MLHANRFAFRKVLHVNVFQTDDACALSDENTPVTKVRSGFARLRFQIGVENAGNQPHEAMGFYLHLDPSVEHGGLKTQFRNSLAEFGNLRVLAGPPASPLVVHSVPNQLFSITPHLARVM